MERYGNTICRVCKYSVQADNKMITGLRVCTEDSLELSTTNDSWLRQISLYVNHLTVKLPAAIKSKDLKEIKSQQYFQVVSF